MTQDFIKNMPLLSDGVMPYPGMMVRPVVKCYCKEPEGKITAIRCNGMIQVDNLPKEPATNYKSLA